MNKHVLITLVAVMAFLGTGWGVLVQHKELVRLRSEQERRTALLAAQAQDSASQVPVDQAASGEASTGPGASEVLRLRSEVSRLSVRQRELAGVRVENDRLRGQLVANANNAPAAAQLPPGYIRKSQAQWMGCGTPEATLQSFLWAVQNRDFTNVLRVLTPASAESIQTAFQQPGNSIENFFKGVGAIPGMAIQSRQEDQAGTLQLQVEFAPGLPPQPLQLQLINGEWKMVGPF